MSFGTLQGERNFTGRSSLSTYCWAIKVLLNTNTTHLLVNLNKKGTCYGTFITPGYDAPVVARWKLPQMRRDWAYHRVDYQSTRIVECRTTEERRFKY
ncbi:hypothetical protein TNCV_4107241 [Trichonephila clavipes]|nr:hypothetical protein TNCV_4107241 [Trichonephila clavipes]